MDARHNVKYFVDSNTAGFVALDWLRQAGEATVQGHTSQGYFLILSEERAVFLTSLPDYGPLNIVSKQALPSAWELHSKVRIRITAQQLTLDHPAGALILDSYQTWQNPPPPAYNISTEEQKERMEQAARQLALLKGDQGFAPLLGSLLNDQPQPLQTPLAGIWEHVRALKAALLAGDEAQFLLHCKPLLGYGRGLTPSGDDFLCGILMTLHRVPENLAAFFPIESAQRRILAIAAEKTTTISRSLLHCATLGSGNALALKMIDVLCNRNIAFEDQAIRLSRWGNSSGADLFVGAAAALQCIRAKEEGHNHGE